MDVSKKHRILYVITKANWGGAQRYVFDVATKAQEQGHEVLVVTGASGELTNRLLDAGIPVKNISRMGRDIRFFREFSVFAEMVRIVNDFKPTVVHSNSSKAGGVASLAARLCGVHRIIFTAHGWAFNEHRPLWQKLLIWKLHYLTVLLTHKTICVSFAMKHDARFMLFVQQKLVVIHNGVSEGTLATREDARMILAPHISFPFWIGTIAELHPTKQLDLLIRAFARIKDRYPETTLMVMGEGQERVHLEELIRSLELESRVRLRGHVEHARAYLSALDMFVLPSRSEGLGYVLLEAGLARLPVIASNVGGIPEVIEDNETGLLIPNGDSDALVEALTTLLDNPERRKVLGDALYTKVRSDFSTDAMIEKTFALY